VTGMGRLWLRFGVAGAFALAMVGDPLAVLTIVLILGLLVKIEGRA
jgi:hypothetical protein